jgi:formylglycine-generating enzyme required for sulfatase activity
MTVALLSAVALAPWLFGRASAEPPPSPSALQEDEETPDDVNPADSEAVPPSPPPPSPSASTGSAALVRDGMVHIPAATFTMGSSDLKSPANERPRHVESVKGFWMDRTEVTVGAYRACVTSKACAAPARTSTSCTYDAGDPLLPMNCVHWREAETYCRVNDKRLPRETEWELAGRGPRGGRYPWRGPAAGCYYAATLVGETTSRSCTKGPTRVGTHPAGASALGLMDMAGNVEEWTSDWYVENLAQGAAPAAGASHVLRGGGWLSPPSAARMTARNWGSSVEAGPNVGFRCAKDE